MKFSKLLLIFAIANFANNNFCVEIDQPEITAEQKEKRKLIFKELDEWDNEALDNGIILSTGVINLKIKELREKHNYFQDSVFELRRQYTIYVGRQTRNALASDPELEGVAMSRMDEFVQTLGSAGLHVSQELREYFGSTITGKCANPGCSIQETMKNKHKKCANCDTIKYCSRECQIKHWKEHKKDCVNFKNSKFSKKEYLKTFPKCANTICKKIYDPKNLLKCGTCLSVMYCSVDCQKEHRETHRPNCIEAQRGSSSVSDSDHSTQADSKRGAEVTASAVVGNTRAESDGGTHSQQISDASTTATSPSPAPGISAPSIQQSQLTESGIQNSGIGEQENKIRAEGNAQKCYRYWYTIYKLIFRRS